MRKNVILICAALAFVTVPSIHAQVTEEWVARYDGPGGSGGDYAEAIALDDAGNVYVTGWSQGSGTDYDYATIKYNTSGGQQWVTRYDGQTGAPDKAYAIALDGSGNVYVTGYSSRTDRDYVTVKYNTSGVQQWAVRYNGPASGFDEALAIAVDDAGNVYVTGRSEGSGTGMDYATVKYNTSGIEQWAVRYDGPVSDQDSVYAIALDGSGNVYVTGASMGSGTSYDYATVKYNSSGVEQWAARYNGPANSYDGAYAIALDDADNVYVTGGSFASGTGRDYATIKYNTSGVEQWVTRYAGQDYNVDEALAIALDRSGNVYVTGRSVVPETGFDYATVKYRPSGVEEWTARYDGDGNEDNAAHGITLDDADNVYVTGGSIGLGTGWDYATVKYDSSGVEEWAVRYDAPSNGDIAKAIAIDGSDNVYVTGCSFGSGASMEYATIKYSQTTGVAEELEPSSLMVSASLNRLRYNLPGSVTGLLSVYSADGQKVVSETVEGTGIWEAPAGLSQGVYFCRMQASAFNDTKKLILFR